MTFREFMQENGYDLITTFWEDFSIADKYGVAGVKDTYKRAFSEWEEVDSCWGYYMETDELIEEIMKEHNLKE